MNMKNLFLLLILAISLPDTVSAQKFLDKVLKGVEKTNKILDETDKILGNDNSSTSSSRRKQASGFQIVSPHPDIEIQFKRCIISGSTVIMDMVITNYGKDAEIQLGGRSYTKVYDDLGNQYNETSVSIADSEMSDWRSALFPTDVPLKFRMQISDINPEVSMFKRINLNIYSRTIKFTEPIIFYNVPVTRRNAVTQIAPSSSEGASTGGLSAMPSTEQATSSSPCFNHPLIDPLICTSYPIPPIAITDISYIDNDWNKLGLKGHVKQVTETAIYGNKNNPPQQTSYIFQENGMLNSIETSDEMYLFTYQNNKLTKILSHDKKKNTTNEYTSPFAKDLHYNEQGQLIENTFGLHTFFSYDDQGACSKITYDDEFPENLAAVTTTFTRNSQGDIRSIHTKTVFHKETTDSNGNRVKGAIEVTSEETCTIEYKYDNHGNWTSMLTGKCPTKYIQAKRIIEYYN